MDEDLYLIWSNEHAGWWKAGGWGYTPGLRAAGRFTRDQAIAISQRALPTALHTKLISEIPVRLADIEAVLKDQLVPEAVMGAAP
jgi:hypothetical protein